MFAVICFLIAFGNLMKWYTQHDTFEYAAMNCKNGFWAIFWLVIGLLYV